MTTLNNALAAVAAMNADLEPEGNFTLVMKADLEQVTAYIRTLATQQESAAGSLTNTLAALADYWDGSAHPDHKRFRFACEEAIDALAAQQGDAVAWMVKRENDNDRAYIYQDEKTARLLAIDGGAVTPLFAHSQSTLSAEEVAALGRCECMPTRPILNDVHIVTAALSRLTSAAKPVEVEPSLHAAIFPNATSQCRDFQIPQALKDALRTEANPTPAAVQVDDAMVERVRHFVDCEIKQHWTSTLIRGLLTAALAHKPTVQVGDAAVDRAMVVLAKVLDPVRARPLVHAAITAALAHKAGE